MAWSAENATKAYLRTLKSGYKGTEPDVAEFLSALAAGSGFRLMVEACGGPSGPTTLALAAAAQQTGGRVVCIFPSQLCESDKNIIEISSQFLGEESDRVELVIGDAGSLLAEEYKGADFVLVDCALEEQERLFEAAVASVEERGGVIVGYNAFVSGGKCCSVNRDLRVDLLPIGGGLSVCRVPARTGRSRWVVKVDECTGEEHVYRVATQSTKKKLVAIE